ncbi:hypothetical protein GCM10011571_10740 [Marinithermofilum abyssi]|uniref:Lipoprotein n=1 Tax=Marinithermofilum abyssi TaxID=1571185 RepID=A0A8J2VFP6_9BACL|nr:hypothetical protein [Marinithermofilum abyssi]GGE11262.1 hypothetical protein GCM10011571_10740 [Marinithermofilum abyssi]
MRRWLTISALAGFLLLTAACGSAERFQQEASNELPGHVRLAEDAVRSYQKEHQKVPPLKRKSLDDPDYPLYVVDFEKIKPYIKEIPSTAFESGGAFVYVIPDPYAKEVMVRVMDLRLMEKMRDLQGDVNAFHASEGRWPRGKKQGKEMYTLSFQAMDMEPVVIPSPYHADFELPVLIDEKGRLHLDYRMDAMRNIQEKNKQPDKKEDLRNVLMEDHPYVPLYSPPMRYEKKEPVFVKK